MSVRSWAWLGLWLLAGVGVACSRHVPRAPRAAAPSSALASAPALALASALIEPVHALQGDSGRGRELVQRFECNRCHEGSGLGASPLEKNCFSCHEQIATGKFKVSAEALARFRPHVTTARDAPSLSAIGARLETSWVRDYLLAPRDLRPKLRPTMPRLALSAEQASDIAVYLSAGAETQRGLPARGGNAARGRELMEQKACTGCHAFSGVAEFPSEGRAPAASELGRSAALAPDLRFTRQRFRRDRLVPWLLDPKAVKADTRMPNFGLSQADAQDLAAYIWEAELAPEPSVAFTRLPVLGRRVSFEEVNARVFSHLSPLPHGRRRGGWRRWPRKYGRLRVCAARRQFLVPRLHPCGLSGRARRAPKLVRAAGGRCQDPTPHRRTARATFRGRADSQS